VGADGAVGVVFTLIGFAYLIWVIRQLNKDMSFAKLFTPPTSGKVGDWFGWLIVVGFLLFLLFSAINSIVTGENGCEPGEYVDKWGNCV
jgi:hypothetical protein